MGGRAGLPRMELGAFRGLGRITRPATEQGVLGLFGADLRLFEMGLGLIASKPNQPAKARRKVSRPAPIRRMLVGRPFNRADRLIGVEVEVSLRVKTLKITVLLPAGKWF